MTLFDKLSDAHIEHLKQLNVLKPFFFKNDWTYIDLFEYIPEDAVLTDLDGNPCDKFKLFYKLLVLYDDPELSIVSNEAYCTTFLAVFTRVITKNKEVLPEIIEASPSDSSMFY